MISVAALTVPVHFLKMNKTDVIRAIDPASIDRRDRWQPTPRPEWMGKLNEITRDLDQRAIMPLAVSSLIDEAVANTGLRDFGEGNWAKHLAVLTGAIDSEANLHFAGRMLTRAELIIYLETRLAVVEAYRRDPAIAEEVIIAPVLITGYGRSGTTILLEVLAQDPRFRVAERWETMIPAVSSESKEPDAERIARTVAQDQLLAAMTPEFQIAHESGARLPVESLELEYPSFMSDVYPIILNIPSYAKYLREHGNRDAIVWQRTVLKLLQYGHTPLQWLLKSPSHLPHFMLLREVFPDLRVIFTHRDPIASADSIVSVMGTLYWLRTDHPWGKGSIESASLATAGDRARQWDEPMRMIREGTLGEGQYANFHYAHFLSDPRAAIRDIYRQLKMTLAPDVEQQMMEYLAAKPKGKHGRHDYEPAPTAMMEKERAIYSEYEQFFDVARER
jgi:hypothetical protein